jgi:acyl-CoA thioesterase FadM
MTAPEPASAGAFETYETTVRDEWVDYNGHLTDWAYAVICSAANEELLDALGLSASYRERTGCATYTVETHLRFLAEVPRGGRLRARSRLVEADAKRLRVRTALVDDSGREVLDAQSLYVHFDQGAGRVVPFPDDRAEILRRTLDAHAGP